jgi:hypothetical protein
MDRVYSSRAIFSANQCLASNTIGEYRRTPTTYSPFDKMPLEGKQLGAIPYHLKSLAMGQLGLLPQEFGVFHRNPSRAIASA